jgi:peptidyl-tRNA hydrolase
MTQFSKLYIVVRGDLAPGLQAAQACHALREFVDQYPTLDKEWHEESKTLVLLSVPTLSDLDGLAEAAKTAGVPAALNFEPDLGGELTSIALGPQAKKLVRPLPLLLQEAA